MCIHLCFHSNSSRSSSVDTWTESFKTFDGPASTSPYYGGSATESENGASSQKAVRSTPPMGRGALVPGAEDDCDADAQGGAASSTTIRNVLPRGYTASHRSGSDSATARPRGISPPFSSSTPLHRTPASSSSAAAVKDQSVSNGKKPSTRATPSSTSVSQGSRSSDSKHGSAMRTQRGTASTGVRRRGDSADPIAMGLDKDIYVVDTETDGNGDARGHTSFQLPSSLREEASMLANMLHAELKRRLLLDSEAGDDGGVDTDASVSDGMVDDDDDDDDDDNKKAKDK